MIRKFISAIGLFGVLFISQATKAADSADQWLQRFSEAMHNYEYSGVLVYSREGQLDAVELSHDVNDQGEQARLSYLDGLPREFLQQGDRITRKISGEVVTSDLIQGRNPSGRLSGGLEKIKQFYQLQLKGQGRVVGRPAVIVEIVPRDNQRLGYRLWLDKESALLLKSVTLDPLARALETFQFTSFSFTAKNEQTGVNSDEAPLSVAQNILPWLPEGFELFMQKQAVMVSEDHLANMYSWSDGVSTFSVFVEPLRADSLKEGHHQYGATVVVIRSIHEQNQGRVITVVGEIPLHTAQKIAAAF
ncbi:MucB/RseB C-terminal domain-containing protein [Oceanospirillum sp.]|uniref:MucB/RseB C-terminal domain-containing protein n=1 Tax=Oceanospirillum sp. TaxID=2021254 RepID=UPI003A926A4F